MSYFIWRHSSIPEHVPNNWECTVLFFCSSDSLYFSDNFIFQHPTYRLFIWNNNHKWNYSVCRIRCLYCSSSRSVEG